MIQKRSNLFSVLLVTILYCISGMVSGGGSGNKMDRRDTMPVPDSAIEKIF
jgi:hypothetical protein